MGNIVDGRLTGNRRSIGRELILLPIIIIVICVVSGIINNNFFTVSNFLAIFQQVAVLGILTGAMLMLLITGMLDLSYGSLIGLCGVALCRFITGGMNPYVALLLMLLIALGGGALNGFIVTKFKVEPLIITIGTGYAFNGLALVWSQGTYQSLQGELEYIGTGKVGAIPVPMIVLVAVLVVVFIVLKYTPYGRRLHIIGGNSEVAFLSGINVNKHKLVAFSVGGLICGLAAFVLCSRIGSALASNGSGYELRALASCIIGGASFSGAKGTVLGAFFGVLLLGIISNALNILGVDPFLQTTVLGMIIVIAVIISNLGNEK
jgi:ribose/xylose/arabinose/galactoside ABC-type transport system permease subunit